MSNINFSEYIESLKLKLENLSSQLEKLAQNKVELWAAFEIDKNQIKKEASSELADYQPQSLNLSLPDSVDLNLEEGDFVKILNTIYKI